LIWVQFSADWVDVYDVKKRLSWLFRGWMCGGGNLHPPRE